MHRRESAKGDAKAPRWMSCGWSPSPTRAERGTERRAVLASALPPAFAALGR